MSYDSAVIYIFLNLLIMLFVLAGWWGIRAWWATVRFMFKVNVAQAFLEKSLDNHEKRKKRK
tara:strand:+ start:612 stop:797 length:186 start_codon:yes stop_codon:yes gene_type:complete